MSWSHLLVAVAPSPESHLLVSKAVALARPSNARVSLMTFTRDPEMYNQFAAPMLENMRELILEETRNFLCELILNANYPINDAIVATGELGEHIRHFCQQEKVDLVICGNHNQNLLARTLCSAKIIIADSQVDALLVSLPEN
ncbi:universal stress protein C [Enterobacter sp. BIGb0383]|uniref:universal stress protein UspC n=1 Tax=unclassified Enterobacter TaxID=2608935 RepID=UPI000F48FE24|nr:MULTISPECIES: universal stress protein UspC [unclassified Enterobacter]ROP62511.1 universal stress protein C [Enterobacter sp. BIGb0383]ROS12671.1 universal stress protein C [Enterobacter sp. BIGb0359]